MSSIQTVPFHVIVLNGNAYPTFHIYKYFFLSYIIEDEYPFTLQTMSFLLKFYSYIHTVQLGIRTGTSVRSKSVINFNKIISKCKQIYCEIQRKQLLTNIKSSS